MNKLLLRFIYLIIALLLFGNLFGQRSVCIYECGNSITNYEANFKNLFNNIENADVSNVDKFEFLSYSYVETISNNKILNYYRNYFSSDKAVRSSIERISRVNKFGRFEECYIEPKYLFQEYEDTTGLSLETKEIITEEFKKRIKSLVSSEIQINSSTLYNYSYQNTEVDSLKTKGKNITRSKTIMSHIVTDSKLSEDCEKVMTGQKSFSEISVKDRQQLALEEIKSLRFLMQERFVDNVSLGDVVYVINFRYMDDFYTNYVVCSKTTKEVVFDLFFRNIKISIK